MSEDRILDARGLKCPLPVLKAARVLREMQAGETLVVLADDPVTSRDMPEFCAEMGHALKVVTKAGNCFRFEIQRVLLKS